MITIRHAVAAAVRACPLVGCVAFALTAGSIANAADAADALEEVQVTGTRIQQRQDFVSPNPITTIGAADLERLGIVNIVDAMSQIPQNVSQFTPANTGGSAFFIGSTLANLRGLNPFFGTRTLTLLDSRRFIATTQGDSVDLNFIPSNLIQRTEVVAGPATGGALLAHTIAGLLDSRRSLTHPPCSFAPFTHDASGALTLRPFYRASLHGKRVLLADDVRNTGETFARAAALARDAGATVLATAEIYDRMEAIKDLGVPNISLAEYKAPENYKVGECPLCQDRVPITRF